MNFDICHKYHLYNLFENSITPHDHFLQCECSKETQEGRVKRLEQCLQTIKTTHRLIQYISHDLRSYYKEEDEVPIKVIPLEC